MTITSKPSWGGWATLGSLVATILLLLASAPAFAQAKTTITCNLESGNGVARVAGTRAEFKLKYCGANQPKIQGSKELIGDASGLVVKFTPNSSGQLVNADGSTATLWGNDLITCGVAAGGSRWSVSYCVNNQCGPAADFNITGSSWNCAQAVPDTVAPVVAAPTGDNTYLRLDGGNLSSAIPFFSAPPAIGDVTPNTVKATTLTAAALAGAFVLDIAHGGTGTNNSTPTAGRFLKSNGSTFATSSGAASGVGACASHNWASTLNGDAVPTCSRPAIADLSDGTTLTTLTGTQELTNKTLTSPVVKTGISADGSGFKHKRVVVGALGANTCVDVTATWTSAFADANYTVMAIAEDDTYGFADQAGIKTTPTAAATTVRVCNTSGAQALANVKVHFIAVHD